MNAKNLIAAALFVVAGTSFAAEAPDATAASSTAAKLNLPTLGAPSTSAREDVKAEAADHVQNYKTTLAVQLEQYMN